MTRTYHVRTFGCQMNLADSDSVEGMLRSLGLEEAAEEEADLVLYNTCAIREKAEHRMLSELGSLRRLKSDRPTMKVGILGCAAESLREDLEEDGLVDLVADGRDLDAMKGAVLEALPEEIALTADTLRLHRAGKLSGMVPAIRGCSYMCSYCIVPRTRGLQRSRPVAEILADVEACLDAGSKEIYLLGQNFLSYGKDLPGRPSPEEMVAAVHDTFPECRRVRFLTSHPHDLRVGFLEAMAALPRVAPYMHLPFQAGSDAVLKAMRRITTRAVVRERAAWVREHWPGATLSTDIIVGFPTETDADFDDTLSLVRDVSYDFAYTFMYSPRPETRAWHLGDPVPREVKAERFARLQAELEPLARSSFARLVGKRVEVLVEGPDRKTPGRWTGRAGTWHRVHFDSPGDHTGRFVEVDVESAGRSSVSGVPAC